MSRRDNDRLQTRAEREARRPGSAPRPQRQRPQKTGSSAAKGGVLANVNWIAIIGGLAAVGLVAFLIYAVTSAGQDPSTPDESSWNKAQLDDDPKLPGVYYPPHPGADGKLTPGTGDDRTHYKNDVIIPICTQAQLDSGNWSDPLCYQSNPPTSGPHAESPMPFGVLQNPGRKENLIHNMEHGGVVVWYNTDDQSVIDKLKKIVEDETGRRKLVVMSKYTDMEPNTIAITAWTRLDKFSVSDFTEKRVVDFIEEHSRRFNPEGI